MGIALLVRRNFQRLYGSSVSSDQPNVHVQRTAASTTHADAQSSSSSSSLLSPIDESQLAKLESVTASAARSPSLGPAEPTAQHDRRSGVFELGGAPILDPCSTVCTIGADDRIPPLPSLELDSNVSVSTARVPDESGSAEENTHRSGNYRAMFVSIESFFTFWSFESRRHGIPLVSALLPASACAASSNKAAKSRRRWTTHCWRAAANPTFRISFPRSARSGRPSTTRIARRCCCRT